MESILLLAIVGRNGSSLDDLRSPIIPRPSSSSSSHHLSTTTKDIEPLTERSLKSTHLSWIVRKRDLSARLEALEEALARGSTTCVAGDANQQHVETCREAVDEAEWVEVRLREAVRWTKSRGVRKASLGKLIKGAKVASSRPTHDSYPLCLDDLPHPLPVASPSNVYTLTVPRPPRIDAERSSLEQERDAPPTYTVEVDVEAGETSVERGSRVVEYSEEGLTRLGSRETT